MKREFLKSLGISDDAIERIMVEYGTSVNSLKSKQTELEEKIDSYKQRISERDQQLEGLKKSASDSEKLQKQIEKLQDDNKKSNEAYEAKIKQMGIDNAMKLALTNAKAKDIDMLRVKLNLDGAELEGDTIKGLDKQISKLKEEYPYMFDGESKPTVAGTKPSEGSKTPAGTNPAPNSYEFFLAQEQGNN